MIFAFLRFPLLFSTRFFSSRFRAARFPVEPENKALLMAAGIFEIIENRIAGFRIENLSGSGQDARVGGRLGAQSAFSRCLCYSSAG